MILDYKAQLNKEQYEAVTTTDGPVLVLAGAGSGKTHCMIHRVAYLIENGAIPEKILLLTFTNKAADEMKARAEKMLDSRCGRITACTFHAFCAKKMRPHAYRLGLPYNFTVLAQNDVHTIFSLLKAERGFNKTKAFPKPQKIASVLSKAINTERNVVDVILEEIKDGKRFVRQLLLLFNDYHLYKRERNMLDFDDILTYFIRLLKENDDIRSAIEESYDYIMVDEYQDTNSLQQEILFLLRKTNNNLAVVGDDAQSIYAFRGSNIQNILSFQDTMKGCKTISLTTNYRSSNQIVQFTNYLINENSTENFPKHMVGTYDCDDLPEIVRPFNAKSEVEEIVRILKYQMRLGDKYSDFAILFRSSRQSNELEIELTKMHVPFIKQGGTKFLDRVAIQDYLAFLRIVNTPSNELAWYRVLRCFSGIGEVYANKIAKEAVTLESGILLSHPYATHKFAKLLSEFKSRFDQWQYLTYDKLLVEAYKEYVDLRVAAINAMNSTEPTKKDDERAILKKDREDISALIDIARGYETLQDFIDAITFDPDKTIAGDSEDLLVLSTIHSAKGLEYKNVIMMDCIDGVCPSTEKGNTEDNEELRCFYVAATRAKEHLYMMVPKRVRARNGQWENTHTAHYLWHADSLVVDEGR